MTLDELKLLQVLRLDQYESMPPALTNLLATSNELGEIGKINYEDFIQYITPIIQALGVSGLVFPLDSSPTVLPAVDPTKVFASILPAAVYTQPSGPNLNATGTLNIAVARGGVYTIFKAIVIDTSIPDGSIVSAKLANGSVTPSKTSFIITEEIVTSLQLFNKDTAVANKKSGKNGVVVTDINTSLSQPIKVLPSTPYRARNNINVNGAVMFTEYDSDMVVIPTAGSDTATSTVITGSSTEFVTLSIRTIDKEGFMFCKGTIALDYAPYQTALMSALSVLIKIPEGSIPDIFREKSVLLTNDDMSTPFREKSVKIAALETEFIKNSVGNQILNTADADVKLGYYLNENNGSLGVTSVNATYNTSGFIPFGDHTQIITNKSLRSVVFYNSSKVPITSSGIQAPPSGRVFEKTGINADAAYIRLCCTLANWDGLMINYGTVAKTYEAYKLTNNIDKEIYTQSITQDLLLEILGKVDSPLLLKSITGEPANRNTSASLASGSTYTVTGFPYHLKKGLSMSFYADLSTFTGSIAFGKGIGQYRGDWIEVDSVNIYWKHYESSEAINGQVAHGLTISTFMKASIYVDDSGKCSVTLNSLSGMFTTSFTWTYEANYAPFIKTNGQGLTNLKINCPSKDFRQPVWAFGDSYFGVTTNRWPGVMRSIGFFNFLIDGLAGQDSPGAYADLLRALNFGTPKYLIWSLGMNDTDAVYQTYFNLVKTLCIEKKITFIPCTIPTVPSRSKEVISAYVRASGYRYVDFYKAVGADSSGNWYAGYLETATTPIHPTTLGAQALATQVLIDFPEIMQYGTSNVTGSVGSGGGDL